MSVSYHFADGSIIQPLLCTLLWTAGSKLKNKTCETELAQEGGSTRRLTVYLSNKRVQNGKLYYTLHAIYMFICMYT